MVSDVDKIKVFISYSRRDRSHVQRLYNALGDREELKVFRDTDDILPTEEWRTRIEKLIVTSDAVILALSPDSVSSEICRWELETAADLKKKIIPVVVADVKGDVPDSVSKINHIFATDPDDLEAVIGSVIAALTLDIDWIREHTRIGELAIRWQAHDRPNTICLRGEELENAEMWLSSHPAEAPRPTVLHQDYIRASRQTRNRQQRFLLAGSLFAAVVFCGLGIFSLIQRNSAIEGELRANEALAAAISASSTMVFDLSQELKTSIVPSSISLGILDKALVLQGELSKIETGNIDLMESQFAAFLELGQMYLRTSETDQARTAFEEALELAHAISKLDPNSKVRKHAIILSSVNLGQLEMRSGNIEAALEIFEKAVEDREDLWGETPDSLGALLAYNQDLSLLGDSYLRLGRVPEAIERYEAASKVFRKIMLSSVATDDDKRDAGVATSRLAVAYQQVGDLDRAREVLEEDLPRARELANQQATKALYKRDLVVALLNLGDIVLDTGDLKKAIPYYLEAVVVGAELAEIDPDNTEWVSDYSSALNRLGEAKKLAFDFDEALRLFKMAHEASLRILENEPGNSEWRHRTASSKMRMGDVHKDANNQANAEQLYKEAVATHLNLAAEHPDNTEYHKSVYLVSLRLFDLALSTGQLEETAEHYDNASSAAFRLAEIDPENLIFKSNIVSVLNKATDLNRLLGDFNGARESNTAAIEIAKEISEASPNNAKYRRDYAVLHFRGAMVERKADRYASAFARLLQFHDTSQDLRHDFPQYRDSSSMSIQSKEMLVDLLLEVLVQDIALGKSAWLVEAMQEVIAREISSISTDLVSAHLLLAQDELDRARELYLSKLGSVFADGKVWEDVVVKDLKNLVRAGAHVENATLIIQEIAAATE